MYLRSKEQIPTRGIMKKVITKDMFDDFLNICWDEVNVKSFKEENDNLDIVLSLDGYSSLIEREKNNLSELFGVKVTQKYKDEHYFVNLVFKNIKTVKTITSIHSIGIRRKYIWLDGDTYSFEELQIDFIRCACISKHNYFSCFDVVSREEIDMENPFNKPHGD
jgi:hypothetical protein